MSKNLCAGMITWTEGSDCNTCCFDKDNCVYSARCGEGHYEVKEK